MFLINTPFVFRSIWACVRPLLDERVQKKITILGADYSSTLLQVIPPGEGQKGGLPARAARATMWAFVHHAALGA
jgi:hypothetical protein